jgi:hypothetical protein
LLSRDIVVIDRADAETLAAETARLLDSLRHAERIARDSTDDTMRTVYAELRTALGCGRWLQGGIREAMA